MALAIDASTPAIASNVGGATTTISPAFSPPAGGLLVLFLNDVVSETPVASITDSLGGHLTYTKQVVKAVVGQCEAEIWTAPCPSAQTNMTVTATFTGANTTAAALIMGIIVFTGAATTQAGATGTGTSGAGAPTVSLASAASTSWIVASICNGTNTTAPTIPGGQTDSFNGHVLETSGAAGGSAWAQANSAAGNTNLTINDTAPSIAYTAAAYEVQAAGAATSIPDLIMAPAHR